MGLFSKLKDRLAEVQQQNRENAKEKTAPKEVFDRMRQKIDQVQKKQQKKRGRTRSGSIFDQIKTKLEEAKRENEASPTEETADSSILDRMEAELDILEQQKDTIEIETKPIETPAWGTPATSTPSADSILDAILGKTSKATEQPKKEPDFGIDLDELLNRSGSDGGSDASKRYEQSSGGSRTSTNYGGGSDGGSDASKRYEQSRQSQKEPDFGIDLDELLNRKGGSSDGASDASKRYEQSSDGASRDSTNYSRISDGASDASNSYTAPKVARNTRLYIGGSALVDGKGGSLAMRSEPNMGASKNRQRLPDNVNVRIVDYTDNNAINIDGVTSGWYQVDYNGQRGWLLGTYLE